MYYFKNLFCERFFFTSVLYLSYKAIIFLLKVFSYIIAAIVCCNLLSKNIHVVLRLSTVHISIAHSSYFVCYVFFQISYSKAYRSKVEEKKRKLVFINNLKFIKEHNKKYDRGDTTFTVGTNEYADLVR